MIDSVPESVNRPLTIMKLPNFNASSFLRAAKGTGVPPLMGVIGCSLCVAINIAACQGRPEAVWIAGILIALVLFFLWLAFREERPLPRRQSTMSGIHPVVPKRTSPAKHPTETGLHPAA